MINWSRQIALGASLIMGISLSELLGEKHDSDPIELTSQVQLFVDDFLIQEMQGVARSLHTPSKARETPVLVADRPWEGGLSLEAGTVLYEPVQGIFRVQYNALPSRDKPDVVESLCYATSTDGVNWEKPNLGLVEFEGSRDNNILLKGSNWYHSVLRDDSDPDADRRYKLAYWQSRDRSRCGIWVAFSPDGIRWEQHPNNPVVPCSASGDTFAVTQDPATKHYYLYNKSRIRPPRKVSRMVSDDFVHWKDEQLILEPDELDEPDTEFYSMAVFPYGSQYLGFLRVFHTYSQLMDVQLASSRDGINWERSARRRVFLPLGFMRNEYGGRSFDSGMNSALAPAIKDDQLWIYYPGFDNLHNAPALDHYGKIGLARLRLDGFCSLDSTSQGYVQTKPLRFRGNSFSINAVVRSMVGDGEDPNPTWEGLFTNAPGGQGSIRIEIQDEGGQAISGYEASSCKPLQGDGIRQRVTWNDGKDLAPLDGKVVRLKFVLTNASLYSFRIGE